MSQEADPEHLLVEIDSASSTAIARSGLARALGGVLKAAELPGTISIHRLGTPELETRSWGSETLQGAAAATPVVINELRIHLPAAITELALAKAIAELDRAIRQWRTESGHEDLEVPVHAGAYDHVVHTIAVDPRWTVVSGPHGCTSDIAGDCWGWRLSRPSGMRPAASQ